MEAQGEKTSAAAQAPFQAPTFLNFLPTHAHALAFLSPAHISASVAIAVAVVRPRERLSRH